MGKYEQARKIRLSKYLSLYLSSCCLDEKRHIAWVGSCLHHQTTTEVSTIQHSFCFWEAQIQKKLDAVDHKSVSRLSAKKNSYPFIDWLEEKDYTFK